MSAADTGCHTRVGVVTTQPSAYPAVSMPERPGRLDVGSYTPGVRYRGLHIALPARATLDRTSE